MEGYEDIFEGAEQAIRQSWEVHRQAFGPILEPAFQESPQVRIALIAALNHLSRRQIQRGMELLKQIREHCHYDEDMAAWAFFVGLGFEIAGARKQMLHWYAEAGKFGHRFYLPYMKLAKAAHTEERFDEARGYYETAIECLLEMSENDKDDVMLGSAYTNLTSCLTMLYRYPEAVSTWEQAQRYPTPPGAAATAAILYAAMGDTWHTELYLTALEQEAPAMLPQIRQMTHEILAGTHSHFK